ncbi:hypothetical protein DRN87_02680, partial [Candidatus Geothermarchaeota archaeon]
NNHIGNLVHRVLKLIAKYNGYKVIPSSITRDSEKELNKLVYEVSAKVEELYYNMRFQRVINEVMKVVKRANAVINDERPWELYKTDYNAFKSMIHTLAKVIRDIAIMLYPIIPDTSIKIFDYLNLPMQNLRWDIIGKDFDHEVEIKRDFKPLFKKIDIEELKKKLSLMRGEHIKIDENYLKKLDLRVGKILEAEYKKGSTKIIRLKVDIGDKIIKILGGLGEYYKPTDLIGKTVVVVANIKEKKIMGEYSEGMLLAAIDEGGGISLLTPDREDVKAGTRVG